MIREGDIGEKMFPDFPDIKVDFAEIGIGKSGCPPPPPPNTEKKPGKTKNSNQAGS